MTLSELEKNVQSLMAYAAIVFGVLTQALAGIHLPPIASAILGVFGVLLHPSTSITAAQATKTTTVTEGGTTVSSTTPVTSAPARVPGA